MPSVPVHTPSPISESKISPQSTVSHQSNHLSDKSVNRHHKSRSSPKSSRDPLPTPLTSFPTIHQYNSNDALVRTSSRIMHRNGSISGNSSVWGGTHLRSQPPSPTNASSYTTKSQLSDSFSRQGSGIPGGMGAMRNKNREYDGLVKLLLLGDSAVGKSSLLTRFCEQSFEASHVLTVGVDFKTKIVDCEGEKVKLQVWDTAGQERFRNITPVYFRSAMGIILVFDVTKAETFQNVTFWMKNLEEFADANVLKILVGNKNDLTNRTVSYQQGKTLADKHNIEYFETSAKTNTNVDEAFLSIAKDIRKSHKDPNFLSHLAKSKNIKLTQPGERLEGKKESGSCCGYGGAK